jgi:hypothetical protein
VTIYEETLIIIDGQRKLKLEYEVLKRYYKFDHTHMNRDMLTAKLIFSKLLHFFNLWFQTNKNVKLFYHRMF